MESEHYPRIRELFDATMSQAPEDRTAFLEAQCMGEPELRDVVQRLLIAHAQADNVVGRGAEFPGGDYGAHLEGQRIGPYEVLRELGQGGMGTVYLARRADEVFRKEVALKVVHPGVGRAEILRRFQQEREIMASLNHPNIARLLDGGSTPDGLPIW